MKAKMFSVMILAGALALPVATIYAANEGESTTQKAKDFVDDATITTKVKADFARDKLVSAMHINVDTDHGVVKLTGKVKSHAEMAQAETLAKGVKGVVSVKNDLVMDSMAK